MSSGRVTPQSLDQDDVEKQPEQTLADLHDQPGAIVYSGVVVKQDGGILSRLRNWEAAMDRKLGVEAEAIARVLPEHRLPQSWHSQAVMAVLWASGTMQLSCLATGFLGPYALDLALGPSIAITILGTFLGAGVSGFCATMGPGTGLRQISISRYSFGWYPSKIAAALNVISQIGWNIVGCITGGVALTAVSDGKVSSVLGVVIIAVGSLIVSFVGLRAIFRLDKYAWFIFFVLWLVLYAQGAKFASDTAPSTVSGTTLSGNCLTLLAIVYGSTASWCSAASDYYVYYPEDTPKIKVFLLTVFGMAVPTSFVMTLGCCIGSAMMSTKPEWLEVYESGDVGSLLEVVLHPLGFSKFFLVVFVLAVIACNCINMYSCALSVQQFARPIAVVPRFFWAIVIFGVILAIAIAGRDSLLTVLEDLLALLGYWNTSFFVILFSEHMLFRKSDLKNYDLEAWNDPSRLPLGIAGLAAFLVGFVGWFLGMVTTWYVGAVARQIGDEGGDVGNELALVLTLVTYVPVRYWELKKFGR